MCGGIGCWLVEGAYVFVMEKFEEWEGKTCLRFVLL